MNATTLQLGPLTLPWSLLALLLGVWLGTWWHERWALRRQLAPGPHGWALPLLALLATVWCGRPLILPRSLCPTRAL